ncbi:uncharacterized protein GGS22DRAFT_195632 [Annulohypoxylon maeteangense]|uniref:uncharacterized protein n=1 Tax=Annulohypoxylon maeteangense TaxID=1927788 RepID=UPI0020089A96|nr:uncharacterized protein GGS22DRAFT_195632 [Annulohypoxylon maeteangense]KAI0882908.1 hypothetical protein GGS22DRAFT_195632 [Annulohypoxylon maeteangense]
MGRAIKYYHVGDMEPWEAIDWETIKSFLWAGYDTRWTGGKTRAEECIDEGVYGDILAIFESFPHLIWSLMQDGKIAVTDNMPYPRPPDLKQVHNSLFMSLQAYGGHIGENFPQRMEAWQQVENCLEGNGFNKTKNQNMICNAVYDALTKFVSKTWNSSNALVIAKAHGDMRYNSENGGFSKRDSATIPALEFSPQMWLVDFDSADTEAQRTEKTQRGIRAIFKLATAETPSQPLSQWSELEIPYYLPNGGTVKLQKAVELGGMVSFQSFSWDWLPSKTGDNTSLNLLNSAGDYLLRISLRQGENAIVLNSGYADGPWGPEERIESRDTFVASNFGVSILHHKEEYELLFSYHPTVYYKKRIPGVISSVSYTSNDGYSPLAGALIVSVFDTMEQLTQTNYLANCEIPGGEYGRSNTSAITTQPTFKRGANFTPVPDKKRKNNLGFEYAEHSYLGDAIILTLSNGNTVIGKDHPFTLENGLTVTYGQINGLAGDFYGTYDPISDGANDTEKADRFMKAYNTLAARSSRQPAEAIEILSILKREIDAVNNALAHNQDPSVAYNNLPDETMAFQERTLFRSNIPSYLGLARINWDHFGVDARTAYNVGHSVALDIAVSGDLEKAYTLNAFADHFLEDSFSAGHLRTPRRYLHSSSWFWPAPDYCAKLMHDEDNAIGLSVKNPKGETWTAYGDKRCLVWENEENKKRCLRSLQVSAREIYSAWSSKTKPSKPNYGAWVHAPTLESARGEQTLAPLIKDEKRRTEIKNRRSWDFTANWTFLGTVLKCYYDGWWNYPITIDGPTGALKGSDVTACNKG